MTETNAPHVSHTPARSGPYTFESHLSPAEFDQFARQQEFANILQSLPWAQVKAEWLPLRVGLRDGQGRLVAAGQILRRPLALGLAFWYLPHGPLLDYRQPDILRAFLQGLADLAKAQKALFVRVHPPCPIREGSIKDFQNGAAQERFNLEALTQSFSQAGFKHRPLSLDMGSTIQPRFQALVRKENWEEPPKGKIRYNLKLNDRYFVEAQDLGTQGLEPFARLIKLTEERQGIRLRDQAYFQRILDAYGEEALLSLASFDLPQAKARTVQAKTDLEKQIQVLGDTAPKKIKQLEEQLVSRDKDLAFYQELGASLTTAEAQEKYQAGILAICYGRAAEMPYAASDERFARIPAMWKLYTRGIRWAFAQGADRYNFGGLEGSFDDGLTVFKSHFDPVIEETAGEYDFAAKPFLYKLAMWGLKLYRKLLK